MSKVLDITGQRFGRLEAVKMNRRDERTRIRYWLCKCDCGNFTEVNIAKLRNGHTKSCGCLMTDVNRNKIFIDGRSKTNLYQRWLYMKKRCYNKNNQDYKDYGGRGITICDEWLKDYTSFKKWAYANGFKENLSIDRIDVNGNYEPSNCRWVDSDIQSKNKRNNVFLEKNGEVKILQEWAGELGISKTTLKRQVLKGIKVGKDFKIVQNK